MAEYHQIDIKATNQGSKSTSECQGLQIGDSQAIPLKTFIFEQEKTNTVTLIKQALIQQQMVSLFPVLEQLPIILENTSFKIYNFNKDSYESVDQVLPYNQFKKFEFPWSYVKKDVILFKYTERVKIQASQVQEQSCSSLSSKRFRSYQRTILDVIQSVKQWRQIYTKLKKSNRDNQKKKPTLYEAAETLGISKKSLDDYYYQLRLGQKFGFDFKNNLHEGIGTLRKYTCSLKPKGRKNGVNERYQKNLKCFNMVTQQNKAILKIISQFGSQQTEKRQSVRDADQNKVSNGNCAKYIENIRNADEQSSLNPFGQMQEDSPLNLQDKFYQEFHYEPQQQKDPFAKNNPFQFSQPAQSGNQTKIKQKPHKGNYIKMQEDPQQKRQQKQQYWLDQCLEGGESFFQ